jgi:hypothetical protein
MRHHVAVILTISFALLFPACRPSSPKAATVAPWFSREFVSSDRANAHWEPTFLKARLGDADALNRLAAAFHASHDPSKREALAGFLEGRVPADPTYHDYLLSLVSELITLDPGCPIKVFGYRVADHTYGPRFEDWAHSQGLDADVALGVVVAYLPLRVQYCQNTERELALLYRVLTLRDHGIAAEAADRLSSLHIAAAISAIEVRATASPAYFHLAFAEAIARFNNKEAWAAVHRLVPEPEYRDFIRQKVSDQSRD